MSTPPESPEQHQAQRQMAMAISYKIAMRLQGETNKQKPASPTNTLKQWIKELLGQAERSVQLDAPRTRIFLQVYTPTHKRAVRILKLPKGLL